jgi:hypothetical protein
MNKLVYEPKEKKIIAKRNGKKKRKIGKNKIKSREKNKNKFG